MLRYIIIRIIWIFVVLITFLSLLFVTIKLVPQHPPTEKNQAQSYYEKQYDWGYYSRTIISDPTLVAKYKASKQEDTWYVREVGDKVWLYKPVPIPVQYIHWVRNVVLHWNWGDTTTLTPTGTPVFQLFAKKLPVTLKLNVLSLLLFLPLGFILGTIAALKKNKLTDNIISLGVMLFISVPNFVVMLLMIMIAYRVPWLQSQWAHGEAHGSVVYTQLILPVLGLSFGAIASITRFYRAELTEVLTSEFLLLARTKGLTKRQAIIRHAMRNSLVPLVPTVIFSFVTLLSGSVIIEVIYSIPGVGQTYLDSLQKGQFDYNMILALSAFYTSISLSAVLLVDMTYGIIDPRIRMGARK